MPEDWQLLVRHRDYRECPMGSLALHLVHRFYVGCEQFPQLAGKKEEW